MKDILFIGAKPSQLSNFKSLDEFKRVECVSQYNIEDMDFNRYSGILMTMYLDQYLIRKLSFKFENFLNLGGKVFYNGHIILPFLKELKEFEPIKNPKFTDFFITQCIYHKIYDQIDIEKLNTRKGVAGFYSRGQNPPPLNADIITFINGGNVCVDWEIGIGNGKFYSHCGNDLYTCGESYEINSEIFKNIISYLGDRYE
ncbi:hypothetical protein CFT12S00416_05320 [Campylobacter fetus subsp. testudinum]|uniref:hypothetical protein n=1 Tax=Campylobacter fetus TaxID=196 RepID=UPI0008189940|nr:hypothetical protein [Campylobacter fetus]OCR88845.1 hypothetical protein CFT12S00416_05320 [Campylobacter fetus subsp. testudinum]OCR99982.1 hypothetical protein A9K75_05435 [Campylobacter fetus subsp. testudinum]